MAGLRKVSAIEVMNRKMASRRAFAEVFHLGIGSIFCFRFQLKTGWEALIDDNALVVDPLLLQSS